MKLNPLFDGVLIVLDDQSGYDDSSNDAVPGTVLAVGEGRREWTGELFQVFPPSVAVGQRVLIRPYAGDGAVHDGKPCRIVDSYNIIAVIEEE